MKKQVMCSWSGGKDSCLALYRATKDYQVSFLMTAMMESGEYSRSHGLTHQVLRAQADALKIPLLVFNTSWEEYESMLKNLIASVKQKHLIEGMIFGDIDLEAHKTWCDKLCQSQNIKSVYPLWLAPREELLSEFLELGFKAKIIAINEKKLPRDYLWKELDKELIEDFRERKIDLCGENGEYHSVVYDGPIFSQPLKIKNGDVHLKDGYWFVETSLV